LRASRKKTGRRAAPAILSARLGGHVSLNAQPNGEIVANFHGLSVTLGRFSPRTADRVQDLRLGLPISAFSSADRDIDEEIALLVRRLARHGLLEYRLGRSQSGADQVVIEPQVPGYWPRMPQFNDADTLVLSRFAYIRRRGNELVLESPRSGALFRICDPKVAVALALLAAPQPIKKLRRQDGFPGIELLALLVDCQILFTIDAANDSGLRPTEGNDSLVLWDFHDLLFHARSTEGQHANPLGGVYPYAGTISPLPAVRSRWAGEKIDLGKFSAADTKATTPTVRLLRERHSVRSFNDDRPITLAELSRFLDRTARVQSEWSGALDLGAGADTDLPAATYTVRPYPSAGSSYELELYLAVDKCEGLARGFYHYDAGGHSLVPIDVRAPEFEALLKSAEFAMGASAVPQVLITIAARFGRVSWKYSSIAYSLILKNVGVLTQTFYMMATDMELGGCAIGSINIDLFARMTGIEFYVEGPVGQFAIGRGTTSRLPG
jgi:SagB-type dehydrogenase family enzyme